MKTITQPYVPIAAVLVGLALLIAGSVRAQVTDSPSVDDATEEAQATDESLTVPVPGMTPAPMVIDGDSTGNILIRGTAQSVTPNSMQIESWGGTWTIRTGGQSAVIPAGPVVGDLSLINEGDFVGIEGIVAQDQDFTVDAVLIRDWTTNPFEGAFEATATTETEVPATGSETSTVEDTTLDDTPGDTTGDSEATDETTNFAVPGDDVGDTATDSGTDDTADNTTSVDEGQVSDITYSGVVDEMSGNSFVFTDDFDSTYTVEVTDDTTVVNSESEVITVDDIAVGDTVEVDGVVEGSTITAVLVRNTSDTGGVF